MDIISVLNGSHVTASRLSDNVWTIRFWAQYILYDISIHIPLLLAVLPFHSSLALIDTNVFSLAPADPFSSPLHQINY